MKIKFTGTGDGRGIPSLGCRCERCVNARENGGKNFRLRVSIIVSNDKDTILYDTPSSIREVLIKEKIFHISAIFLSHKHFDHIGGITEFEYWPEIIPVYGNISVLSNFEITEHLYKQCKFFVLHDKKPVKVGDITITPFEVSHTVPTFGLQFKNKNKRIVHFSDLGDPDLSEYQKKLLRKANVAIFHTPKFSSDHKNGHLDVKSVMEIAKKYPSTQIIISHIGHNNLSHEELEKELADYKNIIVAYDGLEINV